MNKKKDKCKKEVRDVSQFVVKILIIKKRKRQKIYKYQIIQNLHEEYGRHPRETTN